MKIKSMLRNILSNWVAIIIVGITTFLLTPFLIHRLGNIEFGIWMLVSSICGYSGLLEFGLRATVQRYVARFRGLDDHDSLNQTFMTALAMTVATGVFIFVSMFSLAWVLPRFFGLAGQREHDFTSLLIVLGASIGFGLVSMLFGTYLCGWQRFELYNLSGVTKVVTQAILTVVVLRLGYGVVAMGVVTLAGTICFLPLDWSLARHVDPRLRIDWSLPTRARARELLEFSVWMFLNSMGIRLRTFTDSIVIGRVLSVALIAPFSVAGRLMQYFDPIINSIVSPMLPVMSEYDGQGRQQELRDFFLKATKITALVSLLIASILVLDARLLLRVWVGEEFVSTYPLVLILLAGYVFELAQRPSTTALVALGRHRALGSWTLGEGLANLLLSVYWGHTYGLIGVALGTTVPLVVVKLTLQPWYTLRMLGISTREYLVSSLLRPILVCVLFLGGGYWLMSPSASGIFELGFTVAWQGLLFCAITWMVGLSSSEKSQVRERCLAVISTLRMPEPAKTPTREAEPVEEIVNVG
jgi:O-antigen/teichoic acid export membrane protein